MAKREPVKSTFLDRAVAFVSPRRGIRRLAARSALEQARNFQGAAKTSRTRYWTPGNTEINALLAGGIDTLRARSRDLVRNNEWACNAVATVATETIGAGIIPQAKSQNPKVATLADELWTQWGDEVLCDADGLLDFYGIQLLVMKTVAEAGSCLIRRRSRKSSDGLPVPLQLQILEPEFLDKTKDTYGGTSGNLIVNGVEFDALGRRRGYWIYKEHPAGNAFRASLESTFVPASDILHIYRVDRPGQVDGVPWAAPTMIRLRDLDELEDAELVRQKISACFVGAIRDVAPLEDVDGLSDDEKEKLQRIQPGSFEYLPPGKDITFGAPPQNQGVAAHVVMQLRAVSAAFGVTYESITNDYSQVNFSSARMARLRMNRNVTSWQQQMIIPRLCKPVWRWFVEAAQVSGKLPMDAVVFARWSTPRVEMIDPTAETAAAVSQIRSGLSTMSEEIRRSGRDPEEVFAERVADDKKIAELGLVLDSDPRQRSAQGNPTESAAKAPGKPA